jgi:hypothetical protein
LGTATAGIQKAKRQNQTKQGAHMNKNRNAEFRSLIMALAVLACTHAAWTNPTLTPGVWKNITPTAVTLAGTYGFSDISLDPNNPLTVYASGVTVGTYKSTDGGGGWALLGDPSPATNPAGGTTATQIAAVALRVDPKNPLHLYATRGVTADRAGFWVSTDGGSHWKIPPAFDATNTTRDVTMLDVDPTDFNHALVMSHSGWAGQNSSGVLETKDGGATWIVHQPGSVWPGQTNKDIQFLYDPITKYGDSTGRSWLVETNGQGFWRTTDAGANWSQVSTIDAGHGMPQIYYAKNHVLYVGATPYIARSTDNGASWTLVNGGLPYFYYMGIIGDGNSMYTAQSFPDNGAKYNTPIYTSPESDGLTWKPYNALKTATAQTFDNGPAWMAFDRVNRIVYGVNWTAGVWALKVVDPVTTVSQKPAIQVSGNAAIKQHSTALSAGRMTIHGAAGIYDVRGQKIVKAKR